MVGSFLNLFGDEPNTEPDTIPMLEWILDVRIAPELQGLVAQELNAEWSQRQPAQLADVRVAFAVFAEVRSSDAATQAYAREQLQPSFVAHLRGLTCEAAAHAVGL